MTMLPKGVYPLNGRFVVRINAGSRLAHVGVFSTPDEASLNYDSACWYIRYPVSKRAVRFNNPAFSELHPPPKTEAVARLEAKLRQEDFLGRAAATASTSILRNTRTETTLAGTAAASLRALSIQLEQLEAHCLQVRATVRAAAGLLLPLVPEIEPEVRATFAGLSDRAGAAGEEGS